MLVVAYRYRRNAIPQLVGKFVNLANKQLDDVLIAIATDLNFYTC